MKKRICQYCRRYGWETTDDFVTSNGAVRDELCRCGKRHKTCDECWRTKSKVLGDFPKQTQMMPACPPKRPRLFDYPASKVAVPRKGDRG